MPIPCSTANRLRIPALWEIIAVDKNWSVMGGVITGSATGGWDGGFNKQLGNWGGLFWNNLDQ